jgi:hypothetical protein
MFVRLIQATAITLALYGLLGLNNLQASMAKSNDKTDIAETVVEPGEMLVALKQALAGDE